MCSKKTSRSETHTTPTEGGEAEDPLHDGLPGLACVASILAPPSSLRDKLEKKTTPGHIANILQVVLLHDKFDKNFLKWSLLSTEDRDILVLTMKKGAVVESSLVYTICMMYPLRINGPIMIKCTMHIEFLYDNRLLGDLPATTHKNVEFQLGTRLQKRKHQDMSGGLDGSSSNYNAATATTAVHSALPKPAQQTNGAAKTANVSSSSAPALSAPLSEQPPATPSGHEHNIPNLDWLRHKLVSALAQTNNSRIFVDHVTTGLDAAGSWATFRLSNCDKLNLDFIGGFQLSIDNLPVKVQLCMIIIANIGMHVRQKC